MKNFRRHMGAAIAVMLGLSVIGGGIGQTTPAFNAGPSAGHAMAAAVAKTLVDTAVALQSADSNLEAIGVKRLRSEAGVSGLGQVLAIVDSGADPRVFGGSSFKAPERIVDWIDLTGEGAAQVIGEYAAESGLVHVGEIALTVSSLRSRSGTYVVGILPDAIAATLGGYRQIFFVVTDPDSAGHYNTITVDTDSDLNFGDEMPLREFRSDRTYAVVNISAEQSIAIVLSRLDVTRGVVSFGFDLNGHGSGLAALAAGSGVVPGAAPEAEIVVVKALMSDGVGNWSNIMLGVEEAIAAKAGVVLVGSARQQAGEDPEWNHMQSRLASMGSHLVLPVGNAGPGVGTITVTAASDATVLVSGYLPQDSANALLTVNSNADRWYPLSSCGPDPEGNRGPMIAAPAVAAVPSFKGDGSVAFSLMEGTSVSAAYAAGSLALLRQSQSSLSGGLIKSLSFVTASLAQAARTIPGTLPVEQGSGRLDVAESWELLRSRPDHRRLLFVGTWDGSSSSDGIWVEGSSPGAFPVWIDNYAPAARVAYLSTDVPWLRMRGDLLFLEPVSQRETVVYGAGEMQPGFYSGEIVADDHSTVGADTSFVVSVSIPHQFDTSGKSVFDVSEDTAPATRQFIRVPHSAESLALTLVGSKSGQRYAVYSPDGLLVRQGLLDGSVTTRIGLPKPGLWQVCVFAPDGTPVAASPVKVQASLDGFFGFDLGSTLHSQFYLVHSPEGGSNIYPSGGSQGTEWRHRSSFTQQTGRSTQLMLPDVGKSAEALSVRFGAATGNVLRAYLMYFDQLTSRWSEVGRALTTTSGVGEMHLPNPKAGKYTVYIEAYGVGSHAYVEVDVNLLVKPASGSPPGIPASLTAGTSTLEIPTRDVESGPQTLTILRRSDSKVLGVLERPLISEEEVPVVQVSEGSDIKTVRAYWRQNLKPADVLVTIGGVSYQLSTGRITAPIPDGFHPSIRTEDGVRVVLVPENTAS